MVWGARQDSSFYQGTVALAQNSWKWDCYLQVNSLDDSVEDEGFAIGDMIIDMIADTEQRPGVEVIRKAESEMTELGIDV